MLCFKHDAQPTNVPTNELALRPGSRWSWASVCMIVYDGQGITPACVGKLDPTFEVHLPKKIRRFLLEALTLRQPIDGISGLTKNMPRD